MQKKAKQLFEGKTTPRNRDEDEIMGYGDVLNTIHESNECIPIRPSYILQLHHDLLKRTGLSYSGHFKNVQTYINETKSDGTSVTRFTPVDPFDSQDRVYFQFTNATIKKGNNIGFFTDYRCLLTDSAFI